MRYDECRLATIAWALSALSYDEENVQEKIKMLFPMYETHFWSHNHGAHFHGVAIDKAKERTFHVNRGTDGDNPLGNLISWAYDFNIVAGDDGVHNGFQSLGNTAFDEAKRYLEHYNLIIETGHSQGASVSQYNSCLCVENLTLRSVTCVPFGTPPCFKQVGADRFNKHVKSGKLVCHRYTNPNDPVALPALRNKKAILLNGVDVGKEIMLPDIMPHNLGPGEMINHSCRQYNAAFLMYIVKNHPTSEPDINLLAELNEHIVN